LTVPQLAGHSTGTNDRTRLLAVLGIANQYAAKKMTMRHLVDVLDGLNIAIDRKQGTPAWQVRALGESDGPFPGRFNGTEAITNDGVQSLVNYLTATSPEAA
jgi:hypothetical protein